MKFYLPSFEEAVFLTKKTTGFVHNFVDYDETYRLHNFNYLMTETGFQMFENPIPGSNIKAYEMRGLTFVEDLKSKEIQRFIFLPKFYCLNQTIGHSLKDVLNKKIISCTSKLDGSAIRFIKVGNQIVARSKNSFFGPHVDIANRHLQNNDDLFSFVKEAIDYNLAPIFELVSPDLKIVIEYPEEKLRLTQIRDEMTGEFIIDLNNHPLVKKYNIETACVPNINNVQQLIPMQKSVKGEEGWVVIFEDNQLMKVKTISYDDLHDFCWEHNTSDKKILEMILNETIDDAMSSIVDNDLREKVIEYSSLVSDYINNLTKSCLDVINDYRSKNNDNNVGNFIKSYDFKEYAGLYAQAFKLDDPKLICDLIRNLVKSSVKTNEKAESFINKLKDNTIRIVMTP